MQHFFSFDLVFYHIISFKEFSSSHIATFRTDGLKCLRGIELSQQMSDCIAVFPWQRQLPPLGTC
jgi:hypothetical protein